MSSTEFFKHIPQFSEMTLLTIYLSLQQMFMVFIYKNISYKRVVSEKQTNNKNYEINDMRLVMCNNIKGNLT